MVTRSAVNAYRGQGCFSNWQVASAIGGEGQHAAVKAVNVCRRQLGAEKRNVVFFLFYLRIRFFFSLGKHFSDRAFVDQRTFAFDSALKL